MARPYTVNIVNGVGTANVLNGNYTVTSLVEGYDNSSVDPTTLVADNETTSFDYTISATGTLTIHATENGTTTGTSIVGAKFIRCDSLGTTYGNEIVSNEDGNAVFNNVPFSSTNAPLVYYKQTESDGEHEFDNSLKNVQLTINTQTIEVTNSVPLLRTINLIDVNYDGLKIDGQLTLN